MTEYHDPVKHIPRKPPPGEWTELANCIGVDPDFFFPPRGVSTGEYLAVARQLCDGCQVRSECLEYALAKPAEQHGIWGGKSNRERRRIRARRRLGLAS